MKFSKKDNVITGHSFPTNKTSIAAVVTAILMIASATVASTDAAPTRVVQGQGTGTLTCSDGTTFGNSNLSFDAQPRDKGQPQKLIGFWRIFNSEANNGEGGAVQGNIYGGKISKSSFELLSLFGQAPSLCENDPIPSKGTITGRCGLGVDITIQFENGVHGTFTGNTVCF